MLFVDVPLEIRVPGECGVALVALVTDAFLVVSDGRHLGGWSGVSTTRWLIVRSVDGEVVPVRIIEKVVSRIDSYERVAGWRFAK